MTNYHGVHRHVIGGEEKSSHIHSLVRLAKDQFPFRYECKVCQERLKNKSGVLVDDLKLARDAANGESNG